MNETTTILLRNFFNAIAQFYTYMYPPIDVLINIKLVIIKKSRYKSINQLTCLSFYNNVYSQTRQVKIERHEQSHSIEVLNVTQMSMNKR